MCMSVYVGVLVYVCAPMCMHVCMCVCEGECVCMYVLLCECVLGALALTAAVTVTSVLCTSHPSEAGRAQRTPKNVTLNILTLTVPQPLIQDM